MKVCDARANARVVGRMVIDRSTLAGPRSSIARMNINGWRGVGLENRGITALILFRRRTGAGEQGLPRSGRPIQFPAKACYGRGRESDAGSAGPADWDHCRTSIGRRIAVGWKTDRPGQHSSCLHRLGLGHGDQRGLPPILRDQTARPSIVGQRLMEW